ncbi:RNA methyltransferase [Brevibacterium aurantiacum]|uniref:RNA methyltransferase n=1 Tax=Brevibacterium aurantiacum TaxID=273384 RepID=UPI000F64B9E9|nr:RNA methyltransferase [Brevibacterium aurantiacum]AZL10478.1 RNA methyltransferase [Brevibacterium aurantiacum]
MAIDHDLAERVRSLLGHEVTSEKSMFGGLAFLIAGHMAVAVGDDGLLMRVGPGAEWITGDPRARDAMPGRAMRNWRSFSIAADSSDLAELVAHSVEQVKMLPPKK